jgi:hypothetical protein
MKPGCCAMSTGKVAHVSLIVTTTSRSVTASTEETDRNDWPMSALARVASRFSATMSAVRRSPLWNFTPSRSVMVHWVKSSLGVIDSAR